MNDELQNELLSAYLDGELTADERAQVEQLLLANPAARQLLEELRALSTTLKSLPRQKLGVDFSDSVLRIAERRMSAESVEEKMGTGAPLEPVLPEKVSDGSETVPIFVEPLSKTILRRLRNPRIWVWEVVIVAVVLLLLVYNPNRNPNQNVSPTGQATRNIAMAPKPEEKKRSFEFPGMRAVGSTGSANRKDESEALSGSGATTEASKRLGITAADKAPVGPAEALALQRTGEEVGKTDVSGRLEGEEKFAEGKSAAVGEMPAPDKADLTKKGDITLHDKFAAKGMPEAGFKSAALPAEPPAKAKSADQGKAQAASDDELLVVRCEITPEAQKNHTFDKLLLSNSIVLSETPQGTPSDENLPKQEMIQSLLDAENARTDIDRSDIKSEEENLAKGTRSQIEPLKAGPLEIVYVEASPAQIEATLNGLSAQTDTFRNVLAAPANRGNQVQQFVAGDNRSREINKAFRGAQANVVQSKQTAERQSQNSPYGTSLSATNAVQGRAQRIPLMPQSQSLKQPEAARPEQPPATTSATPFASPAPSRAANQEEFAQKAQTQQDSYLRFGGTRITQSGSAAPPGMQRVLFVLQVIEQKNFSDKSKEADAVPGNAAPADAIPDK